ncbi:MAG: response regulator [Acidobacteriota bacterium]
MMLSAAFLSSPHANAAPHPAGATDAAGADGGARILIIDDEDTVRMVVRRVLERAGYAVDDARNGQAGVDRYREAGAAIGLIFLDMTMPGLSGPDTLRALRAIDPSVAVILMSGYGHQDAIAQFGDDADHFADFLQKPFRPTDITEVVARVLAEA